MKANAKRETALGDGLYPDNRSNSYLWRGRVAGKPASKRIKHANGTVATVENMTKTEARRLAKDFGADAANGGQRHFAAPRNDGVTVEQAWDFYWQREASKLRSKAEKLNHWTNIIRPAWGNRALSSIEGDTRRLLQIESKADSHSVRLQDIEVTARNIRGMIIALWAVFGLAISTALAKVFGAI